MKHRVSVPSIDFPLIFRGEGVLRSGTTEITIVNFRAERSKYRPDLPWEVEMRLGEFEGDVFGAPIFRQAESLDIEGTTYEGDSVSIRNFRWHNQSGHLVNGSSYELRQGIVSLDSAPEELILTSYLTDNAVALPLADFLFPDHRGGRKAESLRPATKVTTRLGVMRLWLADTTEKIKIGNRDSRAERPEALLQLRLPKRRRATPLPKVVEQVQDELNDLSRMLSFLSRRPVGCSRIKIFARWSTGDEPTGFHEGEVWQYAPEPLDRDRMHALVNPRRMQPTSFDALYQNYRKHPHKELISRISYYLNEALHQHYVESQMLYAFTAFEAIVNGLDHHAPSEVVGDETFQKIRQVVERAIKSSAAELGIGKTQRRDLYAKMQSSSDGLLFLVLVRSSSFFTYHGRIFGRESYT